MISAVIFDLDGTVLDNEGIWEEAFQAVNAKAWSHEPGIGLTENWKRHIQDPKQIQKSVLATRQAYAKIRSTITPREGTEDLVQFIKEKNWLTALATSSYWTEVEQELEEMDLYLAFDITVTGEEVTRSKPDPEIYLLTAQKLGVEPQDCVVIEDSVAGVTAAVTAGMTVIGIGNPALKTHGASWVVEGMEEVAPILDGLKLGV